MYEGIGGHPVPMILADGATEATALDPALTTIAGLFRQVLISELGAAWTQVTNALGSSHRLYGTSPVADVLELQPTPQVLQERMTKFPLLAVYRKGDARREDHTVAQDRWIQDWGVLWILGQADVNEQRKLGAFLVAGAKMLAIAVRRRGHPDYESGALQFFPTTGGLGSVAINRINADPRRINDQGQTDWLMLELDLQTTEYGGWEIGAYGNVDYMTLDMAVGDATGVIPSFIQADSRYPEDS